MKIKKSQFELYETCIRSGQLEQSEVPKFMEENPEFAAWYQERRFNEGAHALGDK